jgi:hypothetical protein
MQFAVKNWFSGEVQFTAEIKCKNGDSESIKLGLAVRWAIENSADLSGADLRGAYLRGADLRGADLRGAYLSGADLRGAYLRGAYLAIAATRILPDGDLIAWKKCTGGIVVKLRIPEAAKRSHAWGRKCRAEFADVLEVIGAVVGVAQYDGKTEYRVGQRVMPDKWDDDWTNECAGGIHFFITRLEAENY